MARTILLFLLLFACRLFAQQATDTVPGTASPKIEPMRELMTVQFTQSSDVEKLAVFSDGNDIRLSPNAATGSRLGFAYRFVSFGFRFVPRFIPGNNDNDKKGKTRSGGFSVAFNGNHWQQELSYNRTRGYYLENTRDFNSSWQDGDPYLQIPDLVFTQYQGATAYKFNKDFSINAIVSQSERQLESAGTFIPQLSYRYYITDDRTPLTPTSSSQKAKNLEILAGAGYYYNFVWKSSFYLAGGITPSAGVLITRVAIRSRNDDELFSQQNFVLRADGRIGVGYNGKRFFTGVYARYQRSRFRQQGTQVKTGDDRVMMHLSVGFRMKAPDVLRNAVDRLQKKAGIF
jgi:hypothetical protein